MSTVELKSSSSDIPFARDPEQAYTIPARYYLDSDIYQREKEAVFYRHWWYVGHQNQLSDPERSELSEHAVHHFQQLYIDAMEPALLSGSILG
jgi:hypothetical protein